VEVNGVLRQGLEKGLPIVNLMENWDFLQVGLGFWRIRQLLIFSVGCVLEKCGSIFLHTPS
jgi:hypothetical protein